MDFKGLRVNFNGFQRVKDGFQLVSSGGLPQVLTGWMGQGGARWGGFPIGRV
jgi:hypothetical protein